MHSSERGVEQASPDGESHSAQHAGRIGLVSPDAEAPRESCCMAVSQHPRNEQNTMHTQSTRYHDYTIFQDTRQGEYTVHDKRAVSKTPWKYSFALLSGRKASLSKLS